MIYNEEKYNTDHKQLARYAKALGHPVRVQILEFLNREACCYSGDLAELLPIARSTLSQHLKELKEAGLIQGDIELPRIRYCIDQEKWEEAKQLFLNLFSTKEKEDKCC